MLTFPGNWSIPAGRQGQVVTSQSFWEEKGNKYSQPPQCFFFAFSFPPALSGHSSVEPIHCQWGHLWLYPRPSPFERECLFWVAEKWGVIYPTKAYCTSALDEIPAPQIWLAIPGTINHASSTLDQLNPNFKICFVCLCNCTLKMLLPIADKWTMCGWYYPQALSSKCIVSNNKAPRETHKITNFTVDFLPALLCSLHTPGLSPHTAGDDVGPNQ